MKRFYYMFIFLFALVFSATVFALTPEEILLLKRAGVPDEKILEMQKKEGGASSKPTAIPPINAFDWNEDGKKDLLIGNSRGNVYIFFNMGSESSPRFSDDGMKTPISVSGYATPFVADWNGDGKFDVICGSSDGRVYIFINEGDSKSPRFGKPQTLRMISNEEFKMPSRTSVTALDWDNDGKTDLLVSNIKVEGDKKGKHSIGGLKNNTPLRIFLLLNTGTKEKPEFRKAKRIKGNFRDDTVL